MLRKAVIPAAGLGTRLLPITKEMPKEMLPIFAPGGGGEVYVKPLLQLVFEQLHDAGFRKFCFIVGREKRAIEDHFTQDYGYLGMLEARGKDNQALKSFYKKVEDSTIVWVNQPEPKGFGDAVLKAQPFIGEEDFLVHAGDTYIFSDDGGHLKRLFKAYVENDADVAFIIQEVENPRQYGVVEAEELQGVYEVKRAVEKPEEPPTNLAIMPIYIFHPVIFKALERTPIGRGGELQLTDAIMKLIEWGLKVYAIKLKPNEARIDIGTPETYWSALSISYEHVSKECRSLGRLR